PETTRHGEANRHQPHPARQGGRAVRGQFRLLRIAEGRDGDRGRRCLQVRSNNGSCRARSLECRRQQCRRAHSDPHDATTVMDDSLAIALALVQTYPTAARLQKAAAAEGLSRLGIRSLAELPVADRAAVDALRTELERRRIGVALLGDANYPSSLSRLSSPPPMLFYWGNADLLSAPSVGMCGSRNASTKGLDAAKVCGTEVASHGLV